MFEKENKVIVGYFDESNKPSARAIVRGIGAQSGFDSGPGTTYYFYATPPCF